MSQLDIWYGLSDFSKKTKMPITFEEYFCGHPKNISRHPKNVGRKENEFLSQISGRPETNTRHPEIAVRKIDDYCYQFLNVWSIYRMPGLGWDKS